MEVIIHRINNSSKLLTIPKKYGVEIDVRDYKKELILSHDPFKKGELLKNFLKKYNHGTLIVNVKSEFIETKISTNENTHAQKSVPAHFRGKSDR